MAEGAGSRRGVRRTCHALGVLYIAATLVYYLVTILTIHTIRPGPQQPTR